MAEIAQMLKSQAPNVADINTKYEEYTTALRRLITESLTLATNEYQDDSKVTQLKAQSTQLMQSICAIYFVKIMQIHNNNVNRPFVLCTRYECDAHVAGSHDFD
jgi:hypothetical protein